MDTAQSLGIINDGKGLDYFIPKSEEVNLQTLPTMHRGGYIGWVIGAVHNTKKFPSHKIISTCKSMRMPIVILGGKNEFSEGEQIAKAVGNKAFNACGKFSLNQSASLVKQASVIITNDTGLMHIAAAFQKPIISLWGNTIPEFGMSPYYGGNNNRSEIIEVKGLSCRPCSKLGYKQCPKKHFNCMEMIDENRIVELLERFHL
jgi:ADP-heptose:LPS heptosyltransferase